MVQKRRESKEWKDAGSNGANKKAEKEKRMEKKNQRILRCGRTVRTKKKLIMSHRYGKETR